MAFGVSDELLSVVVPIAVYWIGSGIYSIMMGSMQKHRLFTDEEEDAKNLLVTRRQAVVGVVLNQALQTAVSLIFMGTGGGNGGADADATPRPAQPLLWISGQPAVAVVVMDAWQYFWHRWTHENKFLYKHVHAFHHRMVVPYAYGAQYSNPLDTFLGATVGSTLAGLASGMSSQTFTVFLAFINLKSIDDHCGLWFPDHHPFHRFLSNNVALHAFHHHHGVKHNYCNFVFATWDKLLGTYMPCMVEKRDGGGYRLRAAAKHH